MSIRNWSEWGILESSMISPPTFWNSLCSAHDVLNVAKVGRPLGFATKPWRMEKQDFSAYAGELSELHESAECENVLSYVTHKHLLTTFYF